MGNLNETGLLRVFFSSVIHGLGVTDFCSMVP